MQDAELCNGVSSCHGLSICCNAGFAFVKTLGAIGGFAGPWMIGLLAEATDGYAASMAVLACCLLLGGGLCLGFTEPGKHVLCRL